MGMRTVVLSEFVEILTGGTPPGSRLDAWGDELDFITPSDQTVGTREAVPNRRLSIAGVELMRKRLVPARSTNLTCIGATIGKVTMAAQPAVTNQQINTLVARDGISDPGFVYYMVLNWSKNLAVAASGSATPIINKTTLGAYVFEVPDLSEQRAIAEVLGALDDKIAVNRTVSRLSDEVAETTFRAATRDGDTVPLSSLARFVNGKAFTKGATGTGRVVIRIAELNSGLGGSTVRNDIKVGDDHVARPGDLLFAWSGSLTVARWFRDEAIVNQHIFKVIPDGHPPWLVNQAVRSKLRDYQAIAADKATTMGHIQRKHLDEPVAIPDPATTECLDARMSGLWQRALAAEIENEKLAKTRDGLLPLLMSGKLRVKDAEKQIGEVV